jgi:signal transduction histidine kinase/CheY-like chemotaxis protein/HAMP domain-containing protein
MIKLKDLKIGTQLKIGLGATLVFVVLLGAMAWFQTESLWQETKGLYEHPLQVRRAAGEIKADILAMDRGLKDLVVASNEQDQLSILQSIDTYEADANRQFKILYDRFLGPRKDLDKAYEAFIQWKAIRDETVRLLREGTVAQAADRTKFAGIESRHAAHVMGEMKDVSDFEKRRGDQFFLAAQEHKDELKLQLGIVLGAILLLSVGTGYVLLKGIKDPLKELTAVAEHYRQGDLDARSRYESANEFGTLSAAFNSLADTIQKEMMSRENVSRIAEVMLREEGLRSFCQKLLKTLLQHTGSQIGAVYLLNEQKTSFEHFESIGLNAEGRASFSVAQLEGEFGSALATRKIQRVADIPADTVFTFSTVSGDLRPKEIMTIPVLSGQEVVGMISLAGVRNYDESAARLVNDVWSVLTARLNGVLAFQQIRKFSERLEHQNSELEAQKRELSVQTDELSEQNTELEMQKRELDEANRLKTSFISNMSHELRTPLNSVIALSGVLNRRLAKMIPEEEYSYLEVIERNGKNLLSLINDILDLARIEAGREELTLHRFSVKQIAGEILEMLEPQAQEKDISLINSVTDELPPITSDRDKFRHILQNLVANAVKFTDAGQVEIAAVHSENDIRISITDTGIGIHEDRLAYVFDEFRQADESTSKRYGGTGLGLAIAKKYATLLRGHIEVESVPGKGSTFTLTLPITINSLSLAAKVEATEGFATPPGPTAETPAAVGQRRRILLVEDSEPAIIQMKDILSDQGYNILVARNGREALEKIEENLPDTVILDLMMPELDGFEVLARIRDSEKTKHVPVLILTAKHVTAEELSFLKGNHIHQLIQKGDINRKDLLAAVTAMVTPRLVKKGLPQVKPVRKQPQGKPVILVVEDNPDNMLTARALLKDHYRVIEAENGKAGIEQAIAHKPDLILMDISLPVMDGILALKGIREEESLRKIPVIALTASAMKGNREEILAYGFDGYIAKPIEGQAFLEIIREKLHGNG